MTPLPRIMMVSSEMTPWAKSGGLADVVGALPGALARMGHPTAVVLPRYQHAYKAPAGIVIDSLPIELGGQIYTPSVWEMKADGVSVYFIDHPGLYGRMGLYGDQYGEFGDNHIRFALLCRAALEIARRLFPTDIFHCHDWPAGLLPLYLKAFGPADPAFTGAKAVMTIHNLGYQGIFPPSKMPDISLPGWLYRSDLIEFWGSINLLKAGLVYADAITTVSPTYAREIMTPEHGFGLDGLLRARAASVSGIVNGVDYNVWNPGTDPELHGHYSAHDLSGKRVCKLELLREMGLGDHAMDRPLIGIVSRFAHMKGFDLIREIAWELFQDDVYLAVLGSGEKEYENLFRELHARYPDRVALRTGYNEALAHRIEAGADIFLMPSRYEPCGLNQIYSLRYGTVPVVRATGGLDYTVDSQGPDATGFKFTDYNSGALLATIRAACRAWEDRDGWAAMMVRGMNRDFSWEAAAAEYSRVFTGLHPFAA